MPSIEIGSARAKELQDSIQRELAVKGWASANDPVMAEFITIMIINSKSPDQITSELRELIGDDYDPEFTNWLFIEAADGDEIPPVSTTSLADTSRHGASTSPSFPHSPPTGPRIREPASESLSSPSSKRPRSPTDNGPSSRKTPRTSDLPDRPRAMREDKGQPIPVLEQQQPPSGNNRQNGRSLLERMGPPPPQRFSGNQQQPHANNNNNFRGQPHQQQQQQQQMYDPVQAQMDVVAAAQMGMAGFPMPMMTVDQMQMQEIIQSQAMMLSQMNQMMQQFNSQMAAVGGANNTGFSQPSQNAGTFGPGGRGRGRGSAIRGGGRGEGPAGQANGAAAAPASASPPAPAPVLAQTPAPAPASASATVEPSTSSTDSTAPSSAATTTRVVAPQPRTAAAATTAVNASAAPVIAYPERPGTPTLCKYSINCTHPLCRYSHPSPAATVESALVLSNDACEKGNKCDDKDCTKSHVSPATLKPNAVVPSQSHPPARYTSYAKPSFNSYAKPFIPNTATSIPCKFGANCTRANCTFQHPPGRTTLPGEFHRGLKSTDPTVKLNPAVDKARLAAVANVNRYNKTVTFNKPKPPLATPSAAEATPATSDPTPNGVSATTVEQAPQSSPTPAPTEAASAAA